MQLALLLFPLALVGVVGVIVMIALRITARPDHTLPSEVASARRHGLLTSVLAEIAFVATIALVLWATMFQPDAPGSLGAAAAWLGASPFLGGLVALVVLALGEVTWPRPSGTQRTTNLNPRTLADLLPRRWTLLLTGALLVTAAVIVSGWLAADETGAAITVRHPAERSVHTSSPFPGAEYALPQLVAGLLMLLMLAAVLRLVVLRPTVVRSDVPTDNLLRSASVVRAVRVAVSALALTAAGNLFFGGMTAIRAYDPGWQQNLFGAGAILGVVLGFVGIGLVLAPAPRLPRTDPAPPVDLEVNAGAS